MGRFLNPDNSAFQTALLPESGTGLCMFLPDALSCINAAMQKRFIVIIDEWDVLIRDEAANQTIQDEYIRFLRGMFKGTEPTKYIALAYLTGILPIKKLKTQSVYLRPSSYTATVPPTSQAAISSAFFVGLLLAGTNFRPSGESSAATSAEKSRELI